MKAHNKFTTKYLPALLLVAVPLILLFLNPFASWGRTSPAKAEGLKQQIIEEAEKMKREDPERYHDFINIASFIRNENRKQQPIVSVIVARAITDHVHDNYSYRNSDHRLNFLSLLMGIMKIESGYNPQARSYANARGLMQVHFPTWGKYFKSQEDAHHLKKNLLVGSAILRLYLQKSNNDLAKALLMYLGAPANRPSALKREHVQYVRNVVHSALKFKKNYRPIGKITAGTTGRHKQQTTRKR